MSSTGVRFAEAIAAKDRAAVADCLSAAVDFKGLTPGRSWEAATPEEVVAIVLGTWFGDHDHITGHRVEEGEDVADTHRLAYRLEITNDDGAHLVEQQVYYRADDNDRIDYARVVCSGYRPVG